MSLSMTYYFSIVFAALQLSSNSVSAQTVRGWLLSKKWTGVDRGEEGELNWQKCADILYG